MYLLPLLLTSLIDKFVLPFTEYITKVRKASSFRAGRKSVSTANHVEVNLINYSSLYKAMRLYWSVTCIRPTESTEDITSL